MHFHLGNSSSPGAGSEEQYGSSSDTDTRDTNIISSVALRDDPATISVSDSESDEDTIAQECYRIFKEYEPQQSQHTVSKVKMKCHDEL
jgi:hypothetical protein